MPYQFVSPDRFLLWPHQSLNRTGFVWFIGVTSGLIALPLISVMGTAVLWGLVPFLTAAIWAIWFALRKNGRDREIVEDLHLSPTRLTLVRRGPGDKRQDWEANPYWVRVTLHPTAGPVPNYLTLKGDGREVELGAFLSEEERIQLRDDLLQALDKVRRP